MNNFIYFIIYFLLSFFFIGIGTSFSKFFISKKITNYEKSAIPLIGIFVFGNFLVLSHFFINLGNLYFLVFLITGGFYYIFKNYKNLSTYKIYYLNLLILFISSFNIGISKDANLYHLQQQSWLRDEKIVFGLSNINPYLGYSSIMEYINSVFWINGNFIIIHFISLYILASVFEFVFKLLFSGSVKDLNIAYIFIVIGILDNFGIEGGRNGFLFLQEVFKYDHIFSALVCFSILLFFHNLENKNESTFIIILYLLIFALQVRFAGHLFLLFFILSINIFKLNLKRLIPAFLFYSLFSIKNIFISSCLWFPVSFTCFNSLPWSQANQANYISKLLINLNRFPNSKATDNISFNQFTEAFINNELGYVINFLITLFSLIFIYSIAGKKINISFNQIVFSSFVILIWMYLAPKYRFGVPFFLLAYFIVLKKYIASVSFPHLNTYLKYSIYLFVIIFTLRLDSITAISTPQNIHINVSQEEISFIKTKNGWFLYSEEHSIKNYLCGSQKYCYVKEYESDEKRIFSNYTYFKPKNLFYFSNLLEN